MTAPHARVTPAWFFCGQPAVRSDANRSTGNRARAPRGVARRSNGPAVRTSGHSTRSTSSLPSRPPIVPSDGMYGLAVAIGRYVPSAVPRADKTI
jgi:hypothetical protein